ncbi:DUF2325 domain-containing protein [Virgibacillus sp. AGTR]|uniref:DUF2325 domain-containing protein n=1 Tax=Virgibacillus sp. AGTR TaxID=2812055 RepID=UPI001D16BA52|nr:DUF2325 domain-containing protein [Virgibacillus sp. AGTR]MCC2248946.1 DUF2325 domain-containing protein [Virgibacillus sp. AGTR]
MNRQEIFEQTKEQIIHLIQKDLLFDAETIHSVYSGLYQYEQFLHALCDIPVEENLKESDTKTKMELPTTPIQSTQKLQDQQVSNHETVQIENDTEPLYTFTRNLRGGCIIVNGKKVYVPETTIRLLNIEHGDKLILSSKRDNKYFYEIAEKTDDPNTPERATVEYALVEKQDGMLIANRSMVEGGLNIKIDDMLHTFRLPKEDCLKFNLKEGDLIDIAYNPNDPTFHRVIWKYEIEKMEQVDRPQKAGEYKDKTKKTESENQKQELDGKVVLVIGLEPRKAIFQKAIEDRGGQFLFLEGTEQKDRFTSAIRQADVVVILTAFIKHRASIFAVKVCKEQDTPFSIIDTLGVSRILNGAIHPSVNVRKHYHNS